MPELLQFSIHRPWDCPQCGLELSVSLGILPSCPCCSDRTVCPHREEDDA